MAKTLNARVQTKHDIEDNWNQAINFIPKPGEIVIYETPSDIEIRIATAKQEWQEKVAVMNAIADKSSEKYTQAKNDAENAEAKYRNCQSSVVARFKVGNGTTKLIDLPFISAPYVLKEEGKALSDHNYDDRAYNIIDGIKKFEDNNNDTLQYTDTHYGAGAGLSLISDNSTPISKRVHTFNNTGVLDIVMGIENGTIKIMKGNTDGASTSATTVYIKGLQSAAFTEASSYATAAQGKKADTSIQLISPSATINGAITYTTGNAATQTIKIPGLKKLAFQDAINVGDIDLTTFPVFMGARTETASDGSTTQVAGEKGLVPAPAANAGTYVLFGSGEWKPIQNISLEADDNRGIAVNTDGKFVNTGLLNVSLSYNNETGINSLFFSKLQNDYSFGGVTIPLNTPFTGATTDADGFIGAVPAPKAAQQTYALFGSGDWEKIALNYTATLTSSGWSGTVPYIQEVTITGLNSTMNCIADLNLPEEITDGIDDYTEAWGCIDKIMIGDNKITVYCYSDVPTINLPLKLLAIK